MKNYYQVYSNNTFCKYFPQMMWNNMDEYELYFTTVTFEDQLYECDSRSCSEYFKSLFQKINQHTINRQTFNKHLKCKMVFIPEQSYKTRRKYLTTLWHYHGYIMINKKVNAKFLKQCVKKNYNVKDGKKIINKIKLDSALFYRKNTEIIKHYSLDCQPINNDKNSINDICGYMTKNLGYWYDKKHTFNLPDINSYNSSRTEVKNKTFYDKNVFCYEDILFFGDISAKNMMQYTPVKINNNVCNKVKIPDYRFQETPFRRLMAINEAKFLNQFYSERGL